MPSKNVVFLRDYWSFRRGQVVPVSEITIGRAHLVVARGFAEFTDDPPPAAEDPKKQDPPKRRKHRKRATEQAITEPDEQRVRSETTDTTDEPAD